MAFKTIVVEVDNGICLVRLNRPDALNALDTELLDELCAAMDEAAGSGDVRVVVITGSERAFAAGADVREMSEKTFADVSGADMFGKVAERFLSFRKPVIAAVSGYALGGGCELAMMCDFIVASDTAKFGQPEINLGVMPGIGGTQRLTRAVGKAKAMDMNLTGRFMDAEEAERAGLVSRVVPERKLLDEAMAAAARVAAAPELAARSVKEAVNRAHETTLREGLLVERRLFHALFATEDQSEGMAAFVEKREPRFRDR